MEGQSKKVCSRDVICVIAKHRKDAVDIYVQNLKSFEITLTLNFTTLKNLRSNIQLPYTETFLGNQTVKIITLHPIIKSKQWKYKYVFHWIFGSLYAYHNSDYIYSLPYPPGHTYKVTQGFNGKFSHYGDNQYAIDWGMPIGTPIHAARGGTVVGIEDRYDRGGPSKSYRNYANYIMIKHDDGSIGEYVHLKKNGVRVRLSQKVKRGDFIGYSGNVGFSSGPHLHFFVYKAVDGYKRHSFPIQFRTQKHKKIILQEGKSYTAEYNNDRNKNISLEKLSMYETGWPLTKNPIYTKTFHKKKARYIYYSAKFYNLQWKKYNHSLHLTAKYYKGKKLIANFSRSSFIRSSQKTFELDYGWGWRKPGHWIPGRYRVELWAGEDKVGETFFDVLGKKVVSKAIINDNQVRYRFYMLFESGYKPVPKKHRKYRNRFPKSTTCSIYYEVYVRNLLWKKRKNRVFLRAVYYKPNGKILGEAKFSYVIPPNWYNAYLYKGWGWDTPGHWPVGRYGLKLFIGKKKVADTHFFIIDK